MSRRNAVSRRNPTSCRKDLRPQKAFCRQKGFSMIELMVALVLSLVVTAAVISVFTGSRTAYRSMSSTGALTDGGRFALNFIQASARNAGNMGCTSASSMDASGSSSPIQLSLLSGGSGTLAYDFQLGWQGYEASGTSPGDSVDLPAVSVESDGGSWSPNLDSAFTDGSLSPAPTQVQYSDVLVVRSSEEGTPAYSTADIFASSAAMTIQVNTTTPFQVGQIAVISDCTKAYPFQIDSIAANSVSFSAGGGPPGNSGAAIPVPFAHGAFVTPLTTLVYYIGQGADGDAALKRLDLNGANGPGQFTDEELVPDIENMQVLYGLDTTSAGAASEYVTADQVPGGDFTKVVSVKVAVLAAAAPGEGAGAAEAQTFSLLGTTVNVPADNRHRQVFETTITLRNAVP